MKNKRGGPSMLPPYLTTAPVLGGLGVGFAVRVLEHPAAYSAEELRRLAAIYLIVGFVVFGFTTVAQGLIETIAGSRKARKAAREHERRMQQEFPEFWALVESGPSSVLSHGLCGDRDAHQPHVHNSSSLGTFWCTADESKRLPFAAERQRDQKNKAAAAMKPPAERKEEETAVAVPPPDEER